MKLPTKLVESTYFSIGGAQERALFTKNETKIKKLPIGGVLKNIKF